MVDSACTGPNEITIFHPSAFEALDGLGNKNTRSDWYDLIHPRTSTIFERDESAHLDKRRVWDQALSMKCKDSFGHPVSMADFDDTAIREYLPRIRRQIDTLDRLIASSQTQPLILNDIMRWFAFDSMGEFAFNEDFGMMKAAKWHGTIAQQQSALSLLGYLNNAIWIPRLAFAFAGSLGRVKDWTGMIAFCDSRIEKRLKVRSHTHPALSSSRIWGS